MPFGIPWSKYLFHWGIGLSGILAGSQVVHIFYKPLEGFEELVQKEVARIHEENQINVLTKEEKLKAVLELDKEYLKQNAIPITHEQ